MQHDLMNLFAVPVYRGAIGRKFKQEELDFFSSQLQSPIQAVSNFSSENKYVLNAPELSELRKLAEEHLQQYFATVYDTANDARLVITQSWLALTRKGESHHAHSHPNSIASGIIYINLAANDGINFYRDEDRQWFDLKPRQQNYYNAYSYFIEAKIGDIVIFPSHIKHGVRPVETDTHRLSLAFNTFISGEIGREEFSNQLRIDVNS